MHQLGKDDRILAEKYLKDNGQHGCEENVKQQWGLHSSLPQSLTPLEPIQADTVIRLHRSFYHMVELSDGCYHLWWYSGTSEYLPTKGAVDSFVSLPGINQAHEE